MLLHELACRLPPLDIDTFLHHSLTHPSSRYRLSACRRLAATSINTEKGRPFCIKLFVERFSSSFSLIKFFFRMTRRILPTFLSSFCSSLPLQIGFPPSRWAAGECCKVGNFLSLIFFSLRFISLSSHWLLIKINFNRMKFISPSSECVRACWLFIDARP